MDKNLNNSREETDIDYNKTLNNSLISILCIILALLFCISMVQRKELHHLQNLPNYEEGYLDGYNDGTFKTYIDAYNKGYEKGSNTTFYNDTTETYEPQFIEQPKLNNNQWDLLDTIDPPQQDELVVYWGETGTKYHIDPNCISFHGTTPNSGSIEDAEAAGRTDWCGICSKNMK